MCATRSAAAVVPMLDGEIMQVAERRAGDRKSITLQAAVELPDGTLLWGESADISHTGIGLHAPCEVPVEQDCHLTIDLSACGTHAELKLVGRVCYCNEEGADHYRVGMRFVQMDAATAKLLDALLH